MNLNDAILNAHILSTLFMTGLIWFVQIVHYPMFAKVGKKEFPGYEAIHQRLTTFVVAPPMLIELLTGIWLLFIPSLKMAAILGFILIMINWFSTWLLQVPAHNKLNQGFNEEAHHKLVSSNWIRTLSWTLRAGLCVLFLS